MWVLIHLLTDYVSFAGCSIGRWTDSPVLNLDSNYKWGWPNWRLWSCWQSPLLSVLVKFCFNHDPSDYPVVWLQMWQRQPLRSHPIVPLFSFLMGLQNRIPVSNCALSDFWLLSGFLHDWLCPLVLDNVFRHQCGAPWYPCGRSIHDENHESTAGLVS